MIILQIANWTLPALRKIAGKLLEVGEFETLSILEWDESWQGRQGWAFSEGTVARYRNGLLLVRPALEVDPESLLRHELGHHVSLHASGRWHAEWSKARGSLIGDELRGLCGGFADGICEAWGGKPNVVYSQRALLNPAFGLGYERGLEVVSGKV